MFSHTTISTHSAEVTDIKALIEYADGIRMVIVNREIEELKSTRFIGMVEIYSRVQ